MYTIVKLDDVLCQTYSLYRHESSSIGNGG